MRCVAAYESLPTEPPTEALVAALQARGIRVVVPVLRDDLDLDWRDASTPAREGDKARAPLDPADLLGRDAIADAQVVIVPALAVDRDGVRLGQGGGSYDRALARRDPDALVVAVVQDDELVDDPLPHEPHDARVDAVVTPGRGLIPLPSSR